MSKIKIVILVPEVSLGGTERSAINIFNCLDRSLFEPSLVMFKQPSKEAKLRLGNIKPLVVPEKNFIFYLQKNKVDYLFHSVGKSKFARVVNKVTRVLQPIVFTEQYNSECYANLFITMTEHLKAKIYYGNISNDYILYFPIDVERWDSLRKKVKTKTRDKRIVLGRIARAEPSKWHYLVVALLHYIKKKDNFQNYRFVFVGLPKLYQWYIQFFFKKQIKDESIKLMPQTSDDLEVAKFYDLLDVFIQASWIGESFGCVIAEAFCFDCAVITDWKLFSKDLKKAHLNRYDSQLELVDFNKSGYYANYPSSIYSWLQNKNKMELKKMGSFGHAKVKELYSLNSIASNLEKIIMSKADLTRESNYTPSSIEIKNHENTYRDKIQLIKKLKCSVPPSERVSYFVMERTWRIIEYCYLGLRLLFRRIGIDIEKDC